VQRLSGATTEKMAQCTPVWVAQDEQVGVGQYEMVGVAQMGGLSTAICLFRKKYPEFSRKPPFWLRIPDTPSTQSSNLKIPITKPTLLKLA